VRGIFSSPPSYLLKVRRLKVKPKTRIKTGLEKSIGENSVFYPYFYLLPYALFFLIFWVYPLFDGFYVSLCRYDFAETQKTFIAFKHYISLPFDPLFRASFINTFIFVLETTPLIIGVGLGFALLLNLPFLKGKTVLRVLLISPFMLSIAAVCMTWEWILGSQFGLLNYYFSQLRLPTQTWLLERGWSLFAVVLTTLWWTVGFNTILFLAGLQEIPDVLHEAAKIDGAGRWSNFWYITLPCLRPVLLFIIVMQIIASFKIFGQVFIMTGGGPAESSRVMVQHIYETGFQYYRMGEASAIAWVLFAVIMVFTLAQFKVLSKQTIEY